MNVPFRAEHFTVSYSLYLDQLLVSVLISTMCKVGAFLMNIKRYIELCEGCLDFGCYFNAMPMTFRDYKMVPKGMVIFISLKACG